jgi:meromycolic acid enoyl-[acyl-carrier-protein] reductase
MGILEGARVLVTGVAREDSIALAVADRVQREGGAVVLAAFPRDLDDAIAAARSLPAPAVEVVGVDVTDAKDLGLLEDVLRGTFGYVDAALHAVAFAPAVALGGVLDVPSHAVELAFRTSTHSYAALGALLGRLAPPTGGASLVGLDFESSQAWPTYNWMAPVKAALRSLNQYLARDLGPRGVRSNLVAAGPLLTRAAGGIPDFDQLLPWDARDPAPVADAVAFLFSRYARAITGEVLHVDGGVHAVAAGFATHLAPSRPTTPAQPADIPARV